MLRNEDINANAVFREFDPSKTDPLVLVLIWEGVRERIGANLADELQLPYVPPLNLFLLTEESGNKTTCRMILHQSKCITASLDAVAGRTDDDTLQLTEKTAAYHISLGDLRKPYRKDDHTPNLNAIRKSLENLRIRKGAVQEAGVAARSVLLENKYCYVSSHWTSANLKAGKNSRYYWRLRYGVVRIDDENDTWRIFAEVEIGVRPLSEKNPLKTKRIGTTENNSDLVKLLSAYPGWGRKRDIPDYATQVVTRTEEGTERNTAPHKNVSDPVSESKLFTLADECLLQCMTTLCDEASPTVPDAPAPPIE